MRSPNQYKHFPAGRSFILVILFSVAFVATSARSSCGLAADVTLEWDANTEDDLAGYRVYSHGEGENYDFANPVWEGTSTGCTITGLDTNTTYHFVVRAYDTSSNESANSNEVSCTTYTLQLSHSADRSNASMLDGHTVSGNIYVFVSPANQISEASFFIDDSDMVGNPYIVEDLPEYDLAGTGDDSMAHPFDTNHLANGLHNITVLVQSAEGDVHKISAIFTVENADNGAPTADPGPDQTVDEATLVTLDGSGSKDADGTVTSYLWAQTSGRDVTLSNAGSSRPSFTAPAVGLSGETLTFSLTVTDDSGLTDTGSVDIIISNVNQAPIAQSGTDQIVDEETSVVLDGSDSYDPDGTVASYSWCQVAGATVVLTDPNTATPQFLAPSGGMTGTNLRFELTVTDNLGATNSDTVNVMVSDVNDPPVANAGGDQTVNEGGLFVLDGSASSDPDGTVSYSWMQTGGSQVVLSDNTAIQPTATAPDVTADGVVLTFQLTVTDHAGLEFSDTCCVTINWVEEPVTLLGLAIDAPGSIAENRSTQLTATASYSDGSSRTVTDSVTWSDDSLNASVSDGGLLTVLDVSTDESIIVTGTYTYENITETLEKPITILGETFTNLPPATPAIVSPYSGQMECDLQPTVECESFSDPDGDVQGQAQWQISTLADFSTLLLDVTSADELIQFTVPHMMLDYDTTHYVRVRFYDVYLEASEWSEPVEFTTTVHNTDTDGNGIADESDVDYTVDLDQNGISDIDEPDNIKTITTDDANLQIGISTDADSTGDIEAIESVSLIEPTTIEDHVNRPARLDYGLFAYRLRVTTGATVDVKIYFSKQIPAGSKFFMYQTLRGWWDNTDNVTFHEDEKSITVTITDGGVADSDGIANGIIVDPGGISDSVSSTTESISSGGSSSGGGCFVSTVQPTRLEGNEFFSNYELPAPKHVYRLVTPIVDIRNTLVHTFGMSGTLFGLLLVGITLSYLLKKGSTVSRAS